MVTLVIPIESQPFFHIRYLCDLSLCGAYYKFVLNCCNCCEQKTVWLWINHEHVHVVCAGFVQILIDMCLNLQVRMINCIMKQKPSAWLSGHGLIRNVYSLSSVRCGLLEICVEAVYLGHNISSNLKDDSDVYKQVKKLNTIGNVLIRNFASCSEKLKCEFFNAHCSALYCSSLWCSCNWAMYRKLRVSHNDILRRQLVVPRYSSARALFVNKLHDNVDVQTRKQCYNLKLSIEGSHNRVIESIFDSCSFKASKLFAKWRDNIDVTWL